MNEPIRLSVGIRDVRFGKRVKLVEPVNLYGCTLADDVFIGPFVEVQANVTIGRATRIQSHTFICEHVTIGDECFIGHGVMFANDLFKEGSPDPDSTHWGRTVIEDKVCIGSNATILPVRICRGAVIGAGAVVTRDIVIPGTYAGNPARLLRAF
ncbi:UDP-3-O-(3-hydroxymyristoyl) glucosamine N-acyltransferase [Aeromonas allosaccharophila]|uniref:acyltransferase n=1 Tax=Aeromonas allosaccharophila TaxID=656 RepID=UPI000717E4B1|nr:acyltransferase [Aeromonas allosaccharophila]KRW51214.1 UDP-3-O-(3-hydroxymyristoyl) glucosamine N-acyltransferase [Aeromonas allosaccharophila]